jgi:hypothetical protein
MVIQVHVLLGAVAYGQSRQVFVQQLLKFGEQAETVLECALTKDVTTSKLLVAVLIT